MKRRRKGGAHEFGRWGGQSANQPGGQRKDEGCGKERGGGRRRHHLECERDEGRGNGEKEQRNKRRTRTTERREEKQEEWGEGKERKRMDKKSSETGEKE